jgi:NADH-quinone oxidoreductase subunit E
MTPSANQSQHGRPTATAQPSLDLARLTRVLEQFKGKQGALIPILQRTQDIYGYLPKEAIHFISKQTRIPLSRIHGVATFYAQFHLTRRGRNLVRVCDGTACHVRGSGKNLDALQHAVGVAPGETTPDYKLTLEVVYCLGSCGIAPVALVNEKVCARLNADTLVQRVKALG